MVSEYNPYGVEPGQVWQSTDPRDREDSPPRRMIVTRVFGEDHRDHGYAEVTDYPSGRKKRKIRLDRFKPTGSGYERLIVMQKQVGVRHEA